MNSEEALSALLLAADAVLLFVTVGPFLGEALLAVSVATYLCGWCVSRETGSVTPGLVEILSMGVADPVSVRWQQRPAILLPKTFAL